MLRFALKILIPDHRRASTPVRLFFCAAFREKKGLPDALEAVARARREVPELELHVAGDGPLRPRVEALVGRLGLRDCTHLLGFLPHAAMIEWMDRCDLFLQPSRTAPDGDTEGGAPTTLLEAQACGMPILATRHADIPFVTQEGESALLSAEGDVDDLTANLLRLLKAPECWADFSTAGRDQVERHHDVGVCIRSLEQVYCELAGGDPCCPA